MPGTEPMPLHRVAVVRPFATFLADAGAPVARRFQQAGLPYSALEDVNNYVPSQRFWKFLVDTAHAEGIPDLGFRVGERFGADSPDPHMTELLQGAPTLYSGLLKASDLTNRTISHCHVGILQPPDSRYAYFFHRPSCNADHPAIEHIGWFGIMALLDMARVYTGPQWQPAEIGVMTQQPPNDYIREHFPHTRLRLSQAYSYITLESELLCLPPRPDRDPVPHSSPTRYEALADNFPGTLEQALRGCLQESRLSLDYAAGLCNMSRRSLQRRLGETSTCYNEILAHARYSVASRMLQNPAMQVTEVAKRLGYSDVAHFTRAFRRIAGVTPKGYRRQFMH